MTYETFSAGITLNYFRKDSKRTLEIIRENDTLLLNFIEGTLVNLKTQEILLNAHKEGLSISYVNQIKHFLSCIKNDQQPMNSLDESLRIIKIIL